MYFILFIIRQGIIFIRYWFTTWEPRSWTTVILWWLLILVLNKVIHINDDFSVYLIFLHQDFISFHQICIIFHNLMNVGSNFVIVTSLCSNRKKCTILRSSGSWSKSVANFITKQTAQIMVIHNLIKEIFKIHKCILVFTYVFV